MLPTDLLSHRQNGESIIPHRLSINSHHLELANLMITCFQETLNQSQGELDKRLQELEGDQPDYRLKRAFAHLLKTSFCKFEMLSPLDPIDLRKRVFKTAANVGHSPQSTAIILEQIATELSQELKQEIFPPDILNGLYADLNENKKFIEFNPPTPEALIHRYNVSQVQGIFYKASEIFINAHRNDPGEYKLLFRYLKLFQLMTYIEGDAEHGFTITVDGPCSLFKTSTRYGLAIAKMLPALLHVTKWSLQANLQVKNPYTGVRITGKFMINSDCGLVSHYPPGKPYDSMLEASFAERWQSLKTPWKLEREVDLIPIPGSVMIPDFRLVNQEDGRFYLLEIVGYWRPEYLQKKFAQVRRSECDHLILAISERLNLEKAGVNVKDISAKIIWFKDKLSPKAVLEIL